MEAMEGLDSPRFSISLRKLPSAETEILLMDNGSGIDSPHLARVFEPFYTTKQPGKGTGLGLFLVHEILKAHHATINVESKKGEGTRFRILFPEALENTERRAA